MRYITANKLSEGMVLGRPVYGGSGILLLNKGLELTSTIIKKINELKYAGLYVEDEFSDDIIINDFISEALRNDGLTYIKRLMGNVEKGDGRAADNDMRYISRLLHELIDEIGTSSGKIVDIMDIKVLDEYLYNHSVNVCVLCCLIGAAMGLTHKELHLLGQASLLHDIGKIFIPREITYKQGRYTSREMEEMKKHSELGYAFVKDNFGPHNSIYMSILKHHERFDGTGYPGGTEGEKIPLFARIIAVADVFDAATSKRTYHEAIAPNKIYDYIIDHAGTQFAPDIVECFSRKIAPYPTGIGVRLSNGREGLVYQNYADAVTRPLIKLYPQAGQTAQETMLDLKNDRAAQSITVEELVF